MINDPINLIDPSGLVDVNIPGATGENSIRANPGPSATTNRAEHGKPPHIHLGKNDGPKVSLLNFKPVNAEQERRMTQGQKDFLKGLSNAEKNLIRKRAKNVFKTGAARGGSGASGKACRNGGGNGGGFGQGKLRRKNPFINFN